MTNKTTQTKKPAAKSKAKAAKQDSKVVDIPQAIIVKDLSALLKIDPIELIKQLMRGGFMLSMNDPVERDTAVVIATAYGYEVKEAEEVEDSGSIVLSTEGEAPEDLETRPPVVTILGHVDHGKTTLLDAIRKSNVVAGEAGGITQHIGAYQVTSDGHTITFLDTPGHEAFTAMRARGAKVTDMAVVVVAADDGIMPQTEEAIDHVKAAGVPIVVAINKVDRADADLERVKRQLSEHDLLIEEWGGDVIAVPMSALKGEGVDELLDNLSVVAEVAELKANPNQSARGVVVEARIDKNKGPVSTLLIQTGTLNTADYVVAGGAKGRIRAMLDDGGQRIKQAGPSTPVEILGLDGVPEAGETFSVVSNEREAREMVEAAERDAQSKAGVKLEEVHSRIEAGESQDLNLVIKTDVQGSIDAVVAALEQLSTEETRVNILHAASGSITENDVMLALASDAVIIGFNREPEPGARTLAAHENVDVRFYDVIYQLIEDIENALKGLLAPVERDVLEGYATVRAIFAVGRSAKAAGVYVNDGRVTRQATIKVLRSGQELFEGPIASLKHFKDDVRELTNGLEGGITLRGFNDFEEGDGLEAHVVELE